MEHSFDINVARKIGIVEAILLKHIYFWVEKNRANGAELIDGHHWTYNSRKAFTELFPYLSARQIQYALSKLEKLGYILTSNYNESKYDRTLWYTITSEGVAILQNCQMDMTKVSNGIDENVKPIPDINADINADIIAPKSPRKKSGSSKRSAYTSYEATEALERAFSRSYKME